MRVWAGILHDRIIGPFFFEDNVNGENYTDFLMHELGHLLEDTPLDVRANMWFQQDGHPAHTSLPARAALGELFPGTWIGLHSPVQEWAPRSPDLAECDFYLWSMLKSRLPQPFPQNVNLLQGMIREVLAAVDVEEIRSVHECFLRRIGACVAQNGGHFEQFVE